MCTYAHHRRISLITCLTLAVLCTPPWIFAQRHTHNSSSFACDSSYFNVLEEFERQPVVKSPDGKNAVRLTKNYQFQVTVGQTIAATLDLPDISCNVEVGWSPDSAQFFISYSDSGAAGGYHVYLYRVAGNEMKASRVPTQIAERFKQKHRCERGNNLRFLGWTPDSKTGFFVAEVYPTSDCEKLGFSSGYAVSLENGTVLGVFTEKQIEAIEKRCYASGRLVLHSK